MSYFVKSLVQSEYENIFGAVSDFVVVDMTGVSGVDNNILRGELKEKGIHLTIVKNSMMRRALKSLGMDDACAAFGSGPCTVAYGGDSVVDIAKEVVDWAKKIKAIEPRGAFVDGMLMAGDGVKELSKMPTRVELQGQVVQLALTPGANVAGALLGPGGVIAGCVESLIEKLEEAA
ncbi:MAG: 50S ribosomal protein L10 [Planctomycetota bacterium]|nr:MAG: 50S ribosomal protein L10 [Planctomycetota bacterium]RKY14397.1 MAG: 50S ribosomal protein L10 [Planctomycetota bacterium]